jgi:uncharacterized protein (UPF0276 family)
LIEWDTSLPQLETLLDEAARAASLLEEARNRFGHADAA